MNTQMLKDLLEEGLEGFYICPYCGNTYEGNQVCCGENHCELIEDTFHD
jgi:rubrerythrin